MMLKNTLRGGSNKDSLFDQSRDENSWHEVQINRKMMIGKKKEEYMKGFHVHGLTKVFTGTKPESIFWLVMLLAGTIPSILIIIGLIQKYLVYRTFTEIRAEVIERNYFPSVTFCERTLLSNAYFSYCGVKPAGFYQNTSLPCPVTQGIWPNHSVATDNASYWSNGRFNVTKCKTLGGKKCVNSIYFKSLHHLNNSCITWNYKGDLFDIYSHADIAFEYHTKSGEPGHPVIIAIPHSPELHELDLTNKVDIEPFKEYEIKLDKTIIKRLPAPFSSNCTKGKPGFIFPGKYSRRACIESHNYIEMYKRCGDTFDYPKQFIPKDVLKGYRKNATITAALNCIFSFVRGTLNRTHNCPFPCDDLDLGIISTFKDGGFRHDDHILIYGVRVRYQHIDLYHVMEEKELYSWYQMACEIGGLIGLVIGASVISVIEIVAYVFLAIMEKLL